MHAFADKATASQKSAQKAVFRKPPAARLSHSQSRQDHHSGNQLTLRRLQAKLTVNTPGDAYEQEADRVAETVMRMPETHAKEKEEPGVHVFATDSGIQRACKECEEEQKDDVPAVQRMCTHCAEEVEHPPTRQAKQTPDAVPEVTPKISSQIQSLQGGGQPLPASVREFFEPRIGHDFSNVRVHTDPDSTRGLQARAYTVGRNIVFGAGEYAPHTGEGRKLLAHELTHVIQQGAAGPPRLQKSPLPATSRASDVVQRAADPKDIPPGFACPDDAKPSHPAGTDLLFASDKMIITPDHMKILTKFVADWLAAGGTGDIHVHGYASVDGDPGHNWTLSCQRALAVQAELVRLGVPAARIAFVAHGPSTDFGAGAAPNRHAVVETTGHGILPLVTGVLTAHDNFSGRSVTKFGVGEVIALTFFSLPTRPAADFGGLQWVLVSGGGMLAGVTNVGTATYTAPATAASVKLELRVAAGATAGQVISTHAITIVMPSGVRMVAVPGTAPSYNPGGGTIPAGTWGAGFEANVFVDPKGVSFQGVVFSEDTVADVVSGNFLRGFGAHLPYTFGPAHGGNATTGTPVSPPIDHIAGTRPPAGTVRGLGIPYCGASDFLWAIPWEFSVAGGPPTRFATANDHITSTILCNATIEKAGAGPFCRAIDGTTC